MVNAKRTGMSKIHRLFKYVQSSTVQQVLRDQMYNGETKDRTVWSRNMRVAVCSVLYTYLLARGCCRSRRACAGWIACQPPARDPWVRRPLSPLTRDRDTWGRSPGGSLRARLLWPLLLRLRPRRCLGGPGVAGLSFLAQQSSYKGKRCILIPNTMMQHHAETAYFMYHRNSVC